MIERANRASIPADVPVEIRRAVQVNAVDFDQREIELIAVPYGERGVVEYRGRLIEEEVLPGAFDGIERASVHVTANRDHDYHRTIGKVTSYDTADQRGLVARVKVSDTPLGDESLTLANDGVLKASVGMLVRGSDQTVKNGLRQIHRAFLDHIALVPSPAYMGAGVLAVRERQQQDEIPEPDPADEECWDVGRRLAALAEKYNTSRQ